MKKNYLAILLIFGLQIGFGQIGFEDQEITDFTKSLNDYLFVDINGDNHMDIISYDRYTIDLYENTGSNSQFKRKKIIIDDLSVISSFNTFDFDNDGDMDIIAISGEDEKLVWYENLDSQGNFGTEQEIALTTNDFSLYIFFKDIDGDNDDDLILIDNNPFQSLNNIYWLENNGGANDNFTTQNQFSVSHLIEGFIDVDNDGDLDLYGFDNNDVFYYENLGNGSFSDSEVNAMNVNGPLKYATFYDIDSDNDLDIIYARQYFYLKIAYVENDGFGNFGTEQILEDVDSDTSVVTLGGGDIDDDGDEDILILLEEGLYKMENTGNDDYGDFTLIDRLFNLKTFKTNDFDNDGDLDFFVVSNGRSIALIEKENNSDEYKSPIYICANTDEANDVIAADINGNGTLDVVVASYNDGKIVWFESLNGEDYFSEQKIISIDADGAKRVKAADIDGDGDLDVVSISGRSSTGDIDKVSWYENLDGQGTFGDQNTILEDSYDSPDGLLVFDIDNDGDNDVITSLSNWPDGDVIIWYENTDGQGSFDNEYIISTEVDGVKKLLSADIDGDGDLDIVSTSVLDSKVAWYEYINGQGYGPQQIVADNVAAGYDVAVGDIDGDSDLDIAYISGGSFDSVFWHENTNGQGLFGSALIVSDQLGNNGSTAIAIADVDNDGDNDIVCSNRDAGSSDTIIWFPNSDGLGDFDLEQTISSGRSYITSIYPSDFDNDGDIDLLSSSRYGDDIVWHKNLGNAYNLIKGIVYFDLNSDGCDELDLNYENLLISTTDDLGNMNSVFTSDGIFAGEYQFHVGEGTYVTSIASQLPNYYTSSTVSHTSNFTDNGNIDDNVNFCIQPIGTINDLDVSIYPSNNDPRPGFDTTYQLVCKNVGTTQLSGSVSFEFDDTKLQFLNASETVTSQTTNTLNFDFTDLNPLQTKTIVLEFNVFAPPTTNINDIIVSTATINPITGDDENEVDNVFELEQTVVGSYDPNDITVLEGDEIFIEDADKYLHYLIRFQNTGTASAINVSVEHILDDKLDFSTMQIESLSHTGHVEIENQTNVSFIFNNINLPDSTNDEPNSHGYIAFKIKPKSDVQVGDIINGVADIYFDFNPAITTNTVNTEIVETLSIEDLNINTVQLFPNPTKGQLWIKSNKSIEKVKLFNNLGQLLYMSSDTDSINLSAFKSGIYIIELQFYNQTYERKKIIKQ